MRILVAEDNYDSRKLLTRTLQKWGHDVVETETGQEAWQALQREPISLVISDWVMPQMDGLELCRRIRNAAFDHYVYLILLTAKNDKKELVAGMEAGADDFVVKPFNKDELRVRIRAGERILRLERDLEERNHRLQEAYASIRKDLEAAARMQKSLLPESATEIRNVRFEWLFAPCTFLAGDIFNFFRVNERYVGFYHLDVAGHGIPAAMLSVTLSKMLSQSSLKESYIKRSTNRAPYYQVLSPAQVIYDLNQRFQTEQDAMQYFTMVYGLIDPEQAILRLAQAGHPSPILVTSDGDVRRLGSGGFPVGMLPELDYEEVEVDFQPGDRLFVYSDGITECTDAQRQQFSEARLVYHLEKYRHLPLGELLQRLKNDLYAWRGSHEFEDDVSLLAIEGLRPGVEAARGR